MGIRSFIKRQLGRGAPAAPTAPAASAPAENPAAAAQDLLKAMASVPREPDAEGFVAICPSSVIPEGDGNTFKVGDVPVAAYRVQGKVYVVDDECTHENGPLGEGHADGFVVTCPYHDWRFDLRTGECLTMKDRQISCFAVKEADGFVWVGSKIRHGAAGRGGEHDDGLKTVRVDPLKP
ncbi:MAG: Rieske 2Fe-2S domain-containing protein [Alphaproteobacteria bacterium]|nr:Rieske 2Fe-2S domain-containing protein [Alphaproteobacteria bacterium]